MNTCYNALDRHVRSNHGEQLALIYDSPMTNTIEKYTYQELLDKVRCVFLTESAVPTRYVSCYVTYKYSYSPIDIDSSSILSKQHVLFIYKKPELTNRLTNHTSIQQPLFLNT